MIGFEFDIATIHFDGWFDIGVNEFADAFDHFTIVVAIGDFGHPLLFKGRHGFGKSIEDDRLLEGVCDLAFEDEKGWVVVDYKTEAISEDQVLAQASHHAAQLRRYARGLALATESHPSRRFVLFTSLGRQVAV